MNSSLIILLCAISAVLAYPYEPAAVYLDVPADEVQYVVAKPLEYEAVRFKRQLNPTPPPLQGGGGGSPGQGYNINVDGRAPVWTSDNGRHSVHATGGYSQHLGGPYGNSKPDFRGGVGYTFRF